LHVLEFDAEPCALIQRAECIVAMGGYNTISEILAFEKRALIVPRTVPRQEQLIRAERMSELGLLEYLKPDQLSVSALSSWFRRKPKQAPRARDVIDLNGARRLPGLLHAVLRGERVANGKPRRPAPAEVHHATR
jgi:predicted glycosyltransferase